VLVPSLTSKCEKNQQTESQGDIFLKKSKALVMFASFERYRTEGAG